MKRTSFLGSAALVALFALAPLYAGEPAHHHATAKAGKTHDMTVEVVSYDAKAHTLTVKDDAGELHTAPCMGQAIDEAKTVKPGEKVTVTCKDDAEGKHLGVTAIKATKS